MGRALFLIILALPLIEIACFILIGEAIGLWPTLAGVLLTAAAGALLLRYKGLSMLNEIRVTMERGALPGRAVADAMMVGAAGLLLLLPGYFSDLLGLLLLLPPVRGLVYGLLKARMVTVTVVGGVGSEPPPPARGTIDLDSDDWRQR